MNLNLTVDFEDVVSIALKDNEKSVYVTIVIVFDTQFRRPDMHLSLHRSQGQEQYERLLVAWIPPISHDVNFGPYIVDADDIKIIEREFATGLTKLKFDNPAKDVMIHLDSVDYDKFHDTVRAAQINTSRRRKYL